ncbi:MAG: hypothetical protein WBP56_15800, partial [Polyangia bacterium]
MGSQKKRDPAKSTKHADALTALREKVGTSEGPALRGFAAVVALAALVETGHFPRMSNYWHFLLIKARRSHVPQHYEELPDFSRLLAEDLVSVVDVASLPVEERISLEDLRQLIECLMLPDRSSQLRKDLIEAWPLVQELAELESQYRSGNLPETTAKERLNFAGNALLLLGVGKGGSRVLEEVCTTTILKFVKPRKFAKTSRDFEELKQETLVQVSTKRKKWNITRSKGEGNLVNWIRKCVYRGLCDLAMQKKLNPDVTSKTEEPTSISATDAAAAKNAIEDKRIKDIDGQRAGRKSDGEVFLTSNWFEPGGVSRPSVRTWRRRPRSAGSRRWRARGCAGFDSDSLVLSHREQVDRQGADEH